MAHGHVADNHIAADLHAHLVDRLIRPLGNGLVIQGVQPGPKNLGDNVGLGGLPVEQDVFGGGKAGNQGKLLVYHADTGGQGLKGGGKFYHLAVEPDFSLIAAGLPDDVHTKEDLHQRALAGAVLTHQAQHLAGPQGDIDVAQNLVAEEVLLDIPHFQQGSIVVFHSVLLLLSRFENSRGRNSFPCCLNEPSEK